MNTKHTNNCTRVFKNYDLTCPRCIELSNGSAPRDGWQAQYYTNKKREEYIRSKAISEHFKSTEHHNERVCVAFDY